MSSIRINLLLFSTVPPSNSCCFCPVGLTLLMQHFQQVLWVLKLLLSPVEVLQHHKTCCKCCIIKEMPKGQEQQLLDGGTVENKGKLILTEIFPSVQKHDI